jgi:hypothetical protein
VRNKSQIVVLAATLILAAILLLIWRLGGNNAVDGARNYSYNWEKKFDFQSKDPKGLYLFFSLVKFKNPQRPIYEINSPYKFDSVLRQDKNATFVFIGDTIGLLNSELKLLLKKCDSGSSVFLSSNELGSNISDTLFSNLERGFEFNQFATYRFNGENAMFFGRYQNDTIAVVWNGFREFESKFGQADALVRQHNLSTLIRLKLNKSDIFIQSNPEPFTNYQLKHKDGFEHANFVIDQLPQKDPIYFVSVAQVRFYDNQEDFIQEGMESEQNLLELILNNRILLNTLVLILVGGILFVVFRSKRRRAIIPILQKQEDVTKTFVETIASIFLSKQNPYSVLQIQRKNFYDTVLKYYYIDLQRNKDEGSLDILSEKTGYPLVKVQKLLKELRYDNQAVGNDYILQISKLQHDFYHHCGIITSEEIKIKNEFEVSRNIWITTLILITGLTLTFFGLSMLVNSNGLGVILWIFGFLILAFGIVRILIPHLRIHQTEIIFYNQLGIRVKTSESFKLAIENSIISLKFNNKEIAIPHWDVMKNDFAVLKHFIKQTKKL